MTKRVPAEVFPPGEYVRDELEKRGWSQVEFAEILDVSESSVSNLITGKRAVTPEMAKALEAALGPSAEFWLNLDSYYRLHMTPDPAPSISIKARLREKFPVRDMIQRGWILDSEDDEVVESRVLDFFSIDSVEEHPEMPHAARKGMAGSLTNDLSGLQLAWLYRVKHLAEAMQVPKFSPSKVADALEKMRQLRGEPEEIRHLPRILEESGIRFVVVENLPSAGIDGVAFWLNAWAPVVGMSLRLDRIDNFWFVLRHELEHIIQGDADAPSEIDPSREDLSEQERIANEAAADFCVSTEDIEDFIFRKRPIFSERSIRAFAQRHGVHPGLVVGQLQFRLERYDLLRKHLVSVRKFITPYAMTDGYGVEVPV